MEFEGLQERTRQARGSSAKHDAPWWKYRSPEAFSAQSLEKICVWSMEKQVSEKLAKAAEQLGLSFKSKTIAAYGQLEYMLYWPSKTSKDRLIHPTHFSFKLSMSVLDATKPYVQIHRGNVKSSVPPDVGVELQNDIFDDEERLTEEIVLGFDNPVLEQRMEPLMD